MVEFRNILCPTDFSDFSHRALAHAVALARWYESRLTILHVVPLATPLAAFPPVFSPSLPLRPRDLPRAEMEAFARPACAAGIAPHLKLIEGAVTPEILAEAEESRSDLIVMGTHGRSGFERLALGSVAEKVLRRAPSPVLVVGKPEATALHEPPLFRRILCPVDFSRASEQALSHALSLAQQSQARLSLLHVVEWPGEDALVHRSLDAYEYRRHAEGEWLARLAQAVPEEAREWCEVREILSHGKPWREILRCAGEEQAELIVMGVQGRGALDRMLFGSTTHHVVREAACPVLTVRAPS
jgi:nucleotide-binding universal stress UspA family protein